MDKYHGEICGWRWLRWRERRSLGWTFLEFEQREKASLARWPRTRMGTVQIRVSGATEQP